MKATRYTILFADGKQDGSFKTAANAERMRAKCAVLPKDFLKFSEEMQRRLKLRAGLYSTSIVAPRVR